MAGEIYTTAAIVLSVILTNAYLNARRAKKNVTHQYSDHLQNMMSEQDRVTEQLENIFLIDLLNMLPDKIECFIQAPSLDNTVIEAMLQNSNYPYYKLLQLDKVKKDEFIAQELKTNFSMHIQSIEIKSEQVLLFKGFDGVRYGEISKHIALSESFQNKYFPHTYIISSEW